MPIDTLRWDGTYEPAASFRKGHFPFVWQIVRSVGLMDVKNLSPKTEANSSSPSAISGALGLKWRDILFGRGLIAIRQTFVHLGLQGGAKTKLSRSRVEAPKLLLDVLSAWRRETVYADDDNFVFASGKLGGKQPRSGSQLVEDYLRPAAIRAGVIREEDSITYGPDGEVVKRFGFHTFRHSLATCLMEEQETPLSYRRSCATARWT